jgi:SSS family solute:Na+ symporter
MLANIFFRSYFPVLLQSPINAGVFCMLASLIIVPVVSLISKPPRREYVDEIFSCYDKKVVVSAKEAIGDPVQEED